MTKYEKPFSWRMKLQKADGGEMVVNDYNHVNGSRKSMFASQDKALKNLKMQIEANKSIGRKVIWWEITKDNEIVMNG